jgi:hypothetical protein
MNKIYEEQLKINRSKISLNEDGPWKRKQRPTENPRPPQDPFAHYKPAKKQEKQKQPEEPKSELSAYTGTDLAWDAASLADPTGAVDLANAARYAYKGDYVGAAISALGAIPVVGNLATVGKLAKAARKVDDVKMAKRIYPKASTVVEIKPSAMKNTARQALPGSTTTTTAAALPQATKSTALARVGKTATAVGAGAAIATAAEKILKKKKSKNKEDDDGDSKNKMVLDPTPDIGLNIHRLSAFDPGDPSGYAKTTVGSRGGEQSHAGYHPYLTNPLNIDLQRRRSSYAMQRGLPESIEDNLKLKVKRSINNYLKTREGQKLDNHLNQVRKVLN